MYVVPFTTPSAAVNENDVTPAANTLVTADPDAGVAVTVYPEVGGSDTACVNVPPTVASPTVNGLTNTGAAGTGTVKLNPVAVEPDTVIGVCQYRSVWPSLWHAYPILYWPFGTDWSAIGAKLNAAGVPEINPSPRPGFLLICGELPVVLYNGNTDDTPAGATGPELLYVNVATSTDAGTKYVLHLKPANPSPGHLLSGLVSVRPHVLVVLPDVTDTT